MRFHTTRKGYKSLKARTYSGTDVTISIKKGGSYDKQRQRKLRKLKRMANKEFREYKDNLKQIKKNIPLAERSKINVSRVPREFL